MTRKKTVLLICYYFPPIGGGGVPRPLKMAKYLGQFGWNVHVLTVAPAYHATLDPSLLEQIPQDVQIHRAPEWNLLPKRSAGGGSAGTTVAAAAPGVMSQAKAKLRSLLKKIKPYLLIPDDQILWYPAALKLGRELMKQQQFDMIFSTSGPVTNHLIAQKLSAEFGCQWIADFRDPWTQNMHRSGIAWREKLEEKMEQRVMRQANAITTVTASFAKNFRQKYGESIQRLELIYNGFDREDFVGLIPMHEAPQKFHAVYAGILYQKRNPRLLLRAIKQLIDEQKVDRRDLLLSFAGVFDYPGYSENRDCVEQLGLQDIVRVLGNLPHREALGLMKGADALLLIGDVTSDAGHYIPGKLYEYMGIGKPILALNKAGEATGIIQSFDLGQVADPEDFDAVKQAFYQLYQEWKQKRAQQEDQQEEQRQDYQERVKPYERKEQARQLAALMNELLGGQA
ncbi:glycosyltransferase family 4 protein [Brevibacillus fulvus]|uniref:Glycosyltransferase involved in cell wall biosynthesis n=1 Tax=Brevibacillus fulvus TaxID=1125967 RepID=A0A939BU36_9BACL|nr:glycosyltransferase family 4 protein [Brevibacillus fulvus]MBM7590104.1 glycosyltransferase involved in cell wall biosynthesis [Brevibacillus fulvus]